MILKKRIAALCLHIPIIKRHSNVFLEWLGATIENGAHGAYAAQVAKDIFDSYFFEDEVAE